MFDITNCLNSFNSALHGNKWDCSCASGLHRALSDLTNVKFIHKAYCETPELARNQPLDNFKCAGEYVFIESPAQAERNFVIDRELTSLQKKRPLCDFLIAIFYVHMLSTN